MSGKPTPHGTIDRPIPVPIGVDADPWEEAFVSSRVRGAELSSRETLVENGRTYHKCLARGPEGKSHVFLFDVTIRAYGVSVPVPAQISLTDDLKRRLAERTRDLPAQGCFVCHWILRTVGPRGELKKSQEGLTLVGQVRHLALEEIATFTVACSHCAQPLPAHLAFDSDDLSSCRLCDAIRTAEAREGPRIPAPPKPLPPKRGRGRH